MSSGIFGADFITSDEFLNIWPDHLEVPHVVARGDLGSFYGLQSDPRASFNEATMRAVIGAMEKMKPEERTRFYYDRKEHRFRVGDAAPIPARDAARTSSGKPDLSGFGSSAGTRFPQSSSSAEPTVAPKERRKRDKGAPRPSVPPFPDLRQSMPAQKKSKKDLGMDDVSDITASESEDESSSSGSDEPRKKRKRSKRSKKGKKAAKGKRPKTNKKKYRAPSSSSSSSSDSSGGPLGDDLAAQMSRCVITIAFRCSFSLARDDRANVILPRYRMVNDWCKFLQTLSPCVECGGGRAFESTGSGLGQAVGFSP